MLKNTMPKMIPAMVLRFFQKEFIVYSVKTPCGPQQ